MSKALFDNLGRPEEILSANSSDLELLHEEFQDIPSFMEGMPLTEAEEAALEAEFDQLSLEKETELASAENSLQEATKKKASEGVCKKCGKAHSGKCGEEPVDLVKPKNQTNKEEGISMKPNSNPLFNEEAFNSLFAEAATTPKGDEGGAANAKVVDAFKTDDDAAPAGGDTVPPKEGNAAPVEGDEEEAAADFESLFKDDDDDAAPAAGDDAVPPKEGDAAPAAGDAAGDAAPADDAAPVEGDDEPIGDDDEVEDPESDDDMDAAEEGVDSDFYL